MTSASPTASRRHWSLFRATWPRSAPCSPASGSKTKGSIVARSPSAVAVTRSAAPWWVSRSRTAASSMAKCAGTYMTSSIRLHAPSLVDHAKSANEAVEEAVQVGVRVTGQAAVHRSGLDDGGARRGQPPEALSPRPASGAARRVPPRAHGLDAGQGGADGVHVRLPVESEQPDLVDVQRRPEVVARLTVDDQADVHALAAVDPGDGLEQRVLERHVARGRALGLADVAHRPANGAAPTVNQGRSPAARAASVST